MKRLPAVLLGIGLVLPAFGEERHSNGLGGGRWSQPATWHGGTVPGAADHVVITSGDEVVFDGGEKEAPDCAALSIDPEGVLTFRLDGRFHRLMVAGPVESYGIIRVDSSRDPVSRSMLMVGGEDPERRVIRLLRGSSLLLYGSPSTTGGPNAGLGSMNSGNAASVTLEAAGDVMLDLQDALVSGVHLNIRDIDNTGYRPGQRLNLVRNRFQAGGRISLTQCDTPMIAGNRFMHEGDLVAEPAILLQKCSLAACGDNEIQGYALGIDARGDIDGSIRGNRIEGAQTGIAVRGGQNAMLRGNRLKDCDLGLLVDEATGTVETLELEDCPQGVVLRRTTLQLSDVAVSGQREDAVPLTLREAAAILLNVNMPADAIRFEGAKPPGAFWVDTLYYLVVRVSGRVPPRALVQVQTAQVSGGVPAAGADLNVRNSPGRLSPDRRTPLPSTRRALIVRGWRINADKTRREAPFYDLSVVPVVDSETEATKPLHTQVIEPRDNWFRAEPDSPSPTLEVKVK